MLQGFIYIIYMRCGDLTRSLKSFERRWTFVLLLKTKLAARTMLNNGFMKIARADFSELKYVNNSDLPKGLQITI
jgi:hypothetical protein